MCEGFTKAELELLLDDAALLEEGQGRAEHAARRGLRLAPARRLGTALRAEGRKLSAVDHGLERVLDAALTVVVVALRAEAVLLGLAEANLRAAGIRVRFNGFESVSAADGDRRSSLHTIAATNSTSQGQRAQRGQTPQNEHKTYKT